MEAIKRVPDPPKGLREAALRGTLIPFVGAGASSIAGCSSWSEFADAALRFSVEQGKFSHGQLAQISHLHPRVKLSIALGLQAEHKLPIDFRKVLYPNGKDNAQGRRLYENLRKLGKTFVTTNYDEWLDNAIAAPPLSARAVPDPTTPPIEKRRTGRQRVDPRLSSQAKHSHSPPWISAQSGQHDPDYPALCQALCQ
jgi:hypothetical protein